MNRNKAKISVDTVSPAEWLYREKVQQDALIAEYTRKKMAKYVGKKILWQFDSDTAPVCPSKLFVGTLVFNLHELLGATIPMSVISGKEKSTLKLGIQLDRAVMERLNIPQEMLDLLTSAGPSIPVQATLWASQLDSSQQHGAPNGSYRLEFEVNAKVDHMTKRAVTIANFVKSIEIIVDKSLENLDKADPCKTNEEYREVFRESLIQELSDGMLDSMMKLVDEQMESSSANNPEL